MARYIEQPTTVNNIFTTDANFVHTQCSAATKCVINHNSAKKGYDTYVASAGHVQVGQITYNSTNQVTLDFEAAFSGKAFFN